MNSAYISKLMELAEKDKNVIHLLADSGTGYDEIFRKNFPEQIIDFGIAEQNMVAAAAGMATAGKIPFVFTAGAFLAYRSLEFMRDDICFQNLNVKIAGMGSGLSWSSLGPTHHTTEDVSVLRAMPNLMILSPATPNQVRGCVEKAYKYQGPAYIKIGMNNEKEFYDESYAVNDAGMDIMADGADILMFATGGILEEAMKAAAMLKDKSLSAKVVNVTTLKPFSAEAAKAIMQEHEKIFCIEEHNIYGGLSGILSEVVAHNGLHKKIIPIGINDSFAEGYGTYQSVRKRNSLNSDSILKRIMGEL